MKLLKILVVVAIALAAMIGQRFYSYVTNTETPFNEVGIEMLRYSPAPLRDWGCGKLKETFGNKTLPPYGCATGDGTRWR